MCIQLSIIVQMWSYKISAWHYSSSTLLNFASFHTEIKKPFKQSNLVPFYAENVLDGNQHSICSVDLCCAYYTYFGIKLQDYIQMIASALWHPSCEVKWFSLNWFHACLFIAYIISFLILLHVWSKPSCLTLEL